MPEVCKFCSVELTDKEDGMCEKCLDVERQRRTIISVYRGTKRHTSPDRSDEIIQFPSLQHAVLSKKYSDWVEAQKIIMRQLGLSGLQKYPKYIGRSCGICGNFVPRNAKVELCVEHRKQYLKFKNASRQKKFRESKRKQNQ